MPYIKQNKRPKIYNPKTKTLSVNEIETAGDLNYAITMMIKECYENSDKGYCALNDIMGALEGAKLEFYRRVVSPYEDKKIEENGDV